MDVIVVSDPEFCDSECEFVNRLFEEGLTHFHLRKPNGSREEIKRYIDTVDSRYHARIVLHSHFDLLMGVGIGGLHLSEHMRGDGAALRKTSDFLQVRPGVHLSASFHRVEDLLKCDEKYSYVFLSPIFDSISKPGYRSTFQNEDLIKALGGTGQNVIALGGIRPDRIEVVQALGFSGIALLGAIWRSKDPVGSFCKIQELCH